MGRENNMRHAKSAWSQMREAYAQAKQALEVVIARGEV